jgi:hypothetical protein
MRTMVSSPQDHLDYDPEGEAPYWPAQVEGDEKQCPNVVETQGRFLETGPHTPVFVTATDPWHVVDLYHALVRLHGQQSPRRELYGDDADESPPARRLRRRAPAILVQKTTQDVCTSKT